VHLSENSKTLRKLSDDLIRLNWLLNPVEATLMGIHDWDHVMGDVSAEAFRNYAKEFKSYHEALLSKIDQSLLTADERLDYRLALSLASRMFIFLENERSWAKDPGIYPSMAIWGCYGILLHDFAPLDERLEAVLSRLKEIPAMLEAGKRNISSPPRVFIKTALDSILGGLPFFRHVMPIRAAEVPSLESELLSANSAAIRAIEEYGRWLTESITPGSDGEFAIGYDTFHQIMQLQHFLACTPEELVKIGEKTICEIQDEIREVAAEIDPSLKWPEVIEQLKREHPSEDSLMESYALAIQSAKQFVIERDLVTLPPDDRLEVRETPPFERSTLPYAAYMPLPPFGEGNSGYFWVTPIDRGLSELEKASRLLGHSIYSLPVIALHEAYPGHHLQLTRARRLDSKIRRQTWSSLMIEGWALYCENMMCEEGFFDNPRTRLFQLTKMLWRACRVIVDVGIHTGGMSLEEATCILVEKGKLERPNAMAEIRRYAAMPTQPLTYLMGKLIIMDLRDRMKEIYGKRFSLKNFHDRLLDYGSIPPTLISEAMLADQSPNTDRSDLRLRSASPRLRGRVRTSSGVAASSG
jgi:uncharacterized protein (DUF885 family)